MIKITCLSIDCPERKSICCGAISTNKNTRFSDYNGQFVCSKCGKEFIGGECNAHKNTEIAQVQFLIESNAIEDVRDVDSLKQAQYAWDYLMKQDTLSTGVVLKTHKILMLHQKLQPDQKGYFRKEQVWIGNREGMAWQEVPSRVWAWTLEAMRKYPPVDDRALHVLYERIHPFIDGNGRTGRMFMNWMRLKRLNLPLLVIKESEKYEYYRWFE